MKRASCFLRPSDSIAPARALFQQHGTYHLSVVEDGRLAGMVSVRVLQRPDLAAEFADEDGIDSETESAPIAEAVSTDVPTVSPDETLERAAELMREGARRGVGSPRRGW